MTAFLFPGMIRKQAANGHCDPLLGGEAICWFGLLWFRNVLWPHCSPEEIASLRKGSVGNDCHFVSWYDQKAST